jgi:Rieske Fe-S protein
MNEITRRRALAEAAAASTVLLLAACADNEPEARTPAAAAPPPAAPAAPTATADLGKVSDIPVNGGKFFADHGVIVTQPTSGDFKAFSAICTHRGCALDKIADGMITCKCHGARFALTDGSVQGGPAKAPLQAKAIKVDGDNITMT